MVNPVVFSIRPFNPPFRFYSIFGPVLAAAVFSATACADNSLVVVTSAEAASALSILQPYLGKWRPTSGSEELNIGSLTIAADRLTLETGPSLIYEFVKQTDDGV